MSQAPGSDQSHKFRNITREDFHHLDDLGPEEAGLLGTIYVFGTPYHFQFVEVEEQERGYVAVNDPYDRLEDAERLYDQPLMLTEIDGKTYVGYAFPHGD